MFTFYDDEKDYNSDVSIPLLPLRDVVVFPHMIVPLFVGREKSINALEAAMKEEKDILLVAQKKAEIDDPTEEDIYSVGTIGNIIQLLRLPDGTVKVLVEGKIRAHIEQYVSTDDYFLAKAERLHNTNENEESVEQQALMRSIVKAFEKYAKLSKKVPEEMINTLSSAKEPSKIADNAASYLSVKIEEKQKLLETLDVNERLERIYNLMISEIEVIEVENRIKKRVKKQMEKTQKDYYLNEQMRAIQKEMGEEDSMKGEINELENKLNEKEMSPEAHEKVEHEIKKLKMMAPMSAEATVVRNYVDWVLSLPWYEKTENQNDLNKSEDILEEDHYGLKKVKERILEYLAVQMLSEEKKGSILCLVGPPGVGKTSIAKSIARATNRNFVRLSLGGLRDEAEIRGHRRTYIGALPGKIIQMLKKAGSNNPVICLDEIDKLSSDFRGDPASALLEVLDPEQNKAFNDNYLEVDYDLSDIMFITTANVTQTIPAPLLDRTEVIRIAGYTELEKLNIAQKYLVAKQMKENGLKETDISFTRGAILSIIRNYTREAGVRNLEREIASICRKVARKIVSKKTKGPIRVTTRSVDKYLGVEKFRSSERDKDDRIGVTVGLAWTDVGGELLSIEASVVKGTGQLILTGKLGDVMQESAQAARTYVRSRSDEFGLEKRFYKDMDIHVHVPEGAIPKDGPSAGIAIATSIASALMKRKVRSNVAMTGEITLRGRVLPIGGLKEKLLAAHRGEIKTAIIPKENKKDLVDIPQKVLKDINIIFVDNMDEVIENALVPDEKTESTPRIRSYGGYAEPARA